jgi:hypothetical protein
MKDLPILMPSSRIFIPISIDWISLAPRMISIKKQLPSCRESPSILYLPISTHSESLKIISRAISPLLIKELAIIPIYIAKIGDLTLFRRQPSYNQ